jgi:uncharacterized protein
MKDFDQNIHIKAAVLDRLIKHLQDKKDLQNIDLMNLAGFCRNCLSKWYVAAANDRGIECDYEEAREEFYGMSDDSWKNKYQK